MRNPTALGEIAHVGDLWGKMRVPMIYGGRCVPRRFEEEDARVGDSRRKMRAFEI